MSITGGVLNCKEEAGFKDSLREMKKYKMLSC